MGMYRLMFLRSERYFCQILSDVVPVDPRTVDEWVHPPFSGYFDGKFPVALRAGRKINDVQAREFGDEEALMTRAD